MVVAKAQHVHHSTVYDHHDCMRLLKICEALLQGKMLFKKCEINFSTKRRGRGDYASKLKYLASS